MALVMTAIIAINIIVLYIMFTRPTTDQIQHMIDTSIKATSQADDSGLSDIAKLIPSPIPGPAGKSTVGATGAMGQSIVGPPGKDGKDGESIIGPKGDSIVGPPGPPGREVELKKDQTTGDFYIRYTGDVAWQLISAP